MLIDARLKAVCESIPLCETLADVGCDHGKLSYLALKSGRAKRVYACDISEKCLQKAKALLGRLDNVEFIVSDGLKSVPRVEVAVICGMGASTIIDIISSASYKPYYVLGAQKNVAELRRFLVDNGFEITRDFVVKEGRLYYDVICAKQGVTVTDETGVMQGVFYKTPSAVLKQRLEEKLRKYSSFVQNDKNEREVRTVKEALRWQS